MLTPQEAQARLTQFKVDSRHKAIKQNIDQLPEAAGKAARRLLREESGRGNWERHQQALAQAAGQLDELPVDQRTAVFAAAFPKLAHDLERCWQAMKAAPYQVSRMPFRLPRDPSATALRRGQWLQQLYSAMHPIDQDAVWLAKWVAYIGPPFSAAAGPLLAAAIDGGGDTGEQVLRILIESGNGQHEIGMMGLHVIQGLLMCGRPEAWDYMQKMLLAAQREEGLRQAILETVDQAHPQAFRRMLKLLLDENMVRFASVVRAADVWFALRWDSSATGVVRDTLARATRLIDNPAEQAQALAGSDVLDVYFALWAQAVSDADHALDGAIALLSHRDAEMRFAGAWMIQLLQLPRGYDGMKSVLGDEDLRVAWLGMQNVVARNLTHLWSYLFGSHLVEEVKPDRDVFDALVALLPRVPAKPTKLKPMLFPWLALEVSQSGVADVLPHLVDDGDLTRLEVYMPMMGVNGRFGMAQRLSKRKTLPADVRPILLKLVRDASQMTRDLAIKLLDRSQLAAGEAVELETLLTRKSGDLRRGLILLLFKQPDDAALASVDRLLAARDPLHRAAGVELLSKLANDNRSVDECRRRAAAFAGQHDDLTASEQGLLQPLLGNVGAAPAKATLDNALGLMDPARVTQATPLRDRQTKLLSDAALRMAASLDALIHTHRQTTVKLSTGGDAVDKLLGEVQWGIRYFENGKPIMPLESLWTQWYAQRPADCRDDDGLELMRALVLMSFMRWRSGDGTAKTLLEATGVKIPSRGFTYAGIVTDVLDWLGQQNKQVISPDLLLDAAETGLARALQQKRTDLLRWLRDDTIYRTWLDRALQKHGPHWSDDQMRRLLQLLLWLDRPVDEQGSSAIDQKTIDRINQKAEKNDGYSEISVRTRLEPRWLAHGLRLGVLNEHDVFDVLLGWRPAGHYRDDLFSQLSELTAAKPPEAFRIAPAMQQCVDRARQRVLEVELTRGDEPTAATRPAMAIQSLLGVASLVKLLKAMQQSGFVRKSQMWGQGTDRQRVFSGLIRVCTPEPDDTPQTFKAAIRAARIDDDQLLDLSLFAPHWARFVEHALNWPGLEDAVWWVHAHTKDQQWAVGAEVRAQWVSAVAQRTPLTAEELLEGAVDVEWFGRVYQKLKPQRWQQVDQAAKNASSGAGHARAQLFARAMLGKVTQADLLQRIEKTRHQDSLRALGLLPLKKGAARDNDLIERYQHMQEFLRTSKKFGSQRQASEKRAVEIGQANLARTAGYVDPLRLQWAMEARAAEDLKSGSLTVTAGPIQVTLTITDIGDPELAAIKAGKPLASIPPAAKKDAAVKELMSRKTELKRQASRMRQSLEQMMCRGEALRADELVSLCEHPLMRPMFERVILQGDGIIGFPSAGGKVLVDHQGHAEPIRKTESLHIAHPFDLLQRGDWPHWQRCLFTQERVQPFKQAFRELYVLTQVERQDATFSRRYAGQQVNPRQAMALLGQRAWNARPEEGISKTFHHAGVTVWLECQEGFYTPAEIDGLTLEQVRFAKSGHPGHLPLEQVPPMVFSEAMRDLDLVVSVAHRGGVDPEASASTVQMRSDLLRETCALLGIANLRLQGSHAIIEGQMGTYSLHLGSAVTHAMPGGALFIVPVHSQHRGRMFLPFADDDPKTAEVISKALMLARDSQIKDPQLLDQIRQLHRGSTSA
jgi:hypothetical protein